MHLHVITIMFLVFEHISKVFTQGIPVSPCPKMYQYRFDGSEWFGILSVRNPDFGQPLNLRVTLSMRGKPTTNYLGEIELLTRGQFLSDAPVLYKIKFPRNHFPPKLLQITANNQIICLGAADRSIFVTQIQLEHTRKFTFLPEETPLPIHAYSSSDSSFLPATVENMDRKGSHSASVSSTGMKELTLLPTNVQYDSKHFPLTNMEKNPMSHLKDVCGTIDDRIRFQALHALKHSTSFENTAGNFDSTLLSSLMSRQSDEIPGDSKSVSYAADSREDERNGEDDDDNDDDDRLPLLVTSDIDSSSESFLDELPSITRGAWPWLAAIYVNNITSLAYQCGGTLVSSHIVISAAHCFQLLKQHYTAHEVLVFLGRHNLKNWNEEGSLAAPVDDIFLHPDYNQHINSYDGDIAVLVLKNKVRFNTFIRPACLWSGSTKKQYIEGEHGIVVGWVLGGFNYTMPASTTTPVPKILSTPIVSNDVCFQANPKYRSLSSNRTFCAGIISQDHTITETKSSSRTKPVSLPHKLNRGPCSGDSGAGLMIFKKSRWMLRGTVSGLLPTEQFEDSNIPSKTASTTQSCSINQYVIYTDVGKFLDWIFAFML